MAWLDELAQLVTTASAEPHDPRVCLNLAHGTCLPCAASVERSATCPVRALEWRIGNTHLRNFVPRLRIRQKRAK